MKKIVWLLAIALLAGCAGAKKDRSCKDSELYGYVNICLPQIDGMVECRTNPHVQAFTEQYRQTGPMLGYYLNNDTYKRVDSLGQFSFDNYFMIYGDYNRENYEAGEADLPLMQQQLEESLVGTNWQEIGRKVEDVYNTLMVGQPAIIEKYSPQPNVLTMIILMKYQQDNGESTVVSAANCILLKKRLISMAYYMAYDGGQSIDKLKERNNAAVKKLMAIN